MAKITKSQEAAIATMARNYAACRSALVAIIGTDNPDELNAIRRAVGDSEADPENKKQTVKAIDALLLSQPTQEKPINN